MNPMDAHRNHPAAASDQAPRVSFVIVCMDNMPNLRRCLPSLAAHTSVPFEVLVTAYLFSPENLAAARAEFPWARFIESGEIRGFSENNNLALKEAKGTYCFVLNDDTELRMDAAGRLAATLEKLGTGAAIASPLIRRADGSVQYRGRGPRGAREWFLDLAHLGRWGRDRRGGGENGEEVFRTFNICGAAFLIRTDVFREAGWFDERYFFCPEDIALSTKVNAMGYGVWVDAGAEVVHYEGMSGKSASRTLAATRPAGREGALLFYPGRRKWLRRLMRAFSFAATIPQFVAHWLKGRLGARPNTDSVLAEGDWNILRTTFSGMTPKEMFVDCRRRQEEEGGRR